jgi:hypothetical protein
VFCVAVIGLSTSAFGQATGNFGGGGTGTVPTTNTLNPASQGELESGLRDGLSNAGAGDEDIGGMQDQITSAATAIGGAGPLQGATASFFLTAGGNVTKFAVSVVPANIRNPIERDITPIHEEGHRRLDELSVTRVNEVIASGRAGPTTPADVIRLLICYEDSANATFEFEFGASAPATMRNLRSSGLLAAAGGNRVSAARVLETNAVEDGDRAGQESLLLCTRPT